MSTSYHPVDDSLIMIGRSLRHTVRNIDSLLTGVLLPVMILALFTLVFGGAMDTGEFAYIDYVVPGVVLLCAGYGSSMTAISVTKDMTEGIVARFRTMTVVPSAVLTGHVVASSARNLVSTALVIAVALLLGFEPNATPWEWLAAAGLILLFIFAMSWLCAMFGLLTRSVDAAAAVGFFVLFLPYVSSAFVPVNTMPGWMQPIAEHQPITPIIETARGLLLGTPIGSSGWIAVAWCLAIAACSIAGSAALWIHSRGRA
jgi:ABC-2 type transport system permease protein